MLCDFLGYVVRGHLASTFALSAQARDPGATGEARTPRHCCAGEARAVRTEAEMCQVLQLLSDFNCIATPRQNHWEQ